MERQQLIQLWQYLLALLLVWLFVVFVMNQSFVDFLINYRLYIIIVSISYFYYYNIKYEPDKKYDFIRNVIIYGNIYLFCHIFFRPLLNISHQLFILLWLIILWLWWTTKLKTNWRYLLQIIWSIFSFFIMISWVFYFYPEPPDIHWFLLTRNNEIRVLWVENSIEKRDAYIQIVNSRGANDFEIRPYFTQTLLEDSRVIYPSIKLERDENVIIVTKEWWVFWIFPQTDIQLQFSWNEIEKVLQVTWRVWVLSWVLTSSVQFIWTWENLSDNQKEWLEWVQEWYKYELVSYLKDQISESNIWWANNTIMYNIDWKIIKYLSRMFPVTFADNLDNYNEFQKYFSRFDGWINLRKYSTEQSYWSWFSSVWNSLKRNFNAWKINTYSLFD